jgi:repressor LexA
VENLTSRQAQILTFIEKRVVEAGFPPTLREIGEELGIRSTNAVSDHLKALERKGYLSRHDNRSRGLTLKHPEGEAGGLRGGVVSALAPRGRAVAIPLLGRVAAGEPILAFEDARDSVTVDSFLIGDATKVYALRVVGQSMIDDGILDGDYIFVRKQPQAERGAIVVAMIEGEATVKRYYPEKDHIRFQPANQAMQPIVVARDAFRETQILGTVVGVFRRV